MIDPAILTPAAPAKPNAGTSVLSVTPQSANAFAEEFGSALRTMRRNDTTPAGERSTKTANPAAIEAPRQQDQPAGVTDRGTAEHPSTPDTAREGQPGGSNAKAERTDSPNQPSKEIQALGSNNDGPIAEATAAQEVSGPEETPEAALAVDALKHLLTQGALTPAAMADSPVALDQTASVHLPQALGIDSTQVQALGPTSPSVGSDAAPGDGEAIDVAESIPASQDGQGVEAVGVQPEAGGSGAAQSEPVNHEHQPSTAQAIPATDISGDGQPAPAQRNVTEVRGDRPLPDASKAPQGDGVPTTSMGEAVSNSVDEPFVAQPEGVHRSKPTTALESSEVGETDAVHEGTTSEGVKLNQAEPNADQGDNPLPQQSQPAPHQPTKVDAGTSQLLVDGPQPASQSAGISSPAASSTAQGQQPSQPAPMPTLTPAQQLASAMGALRRRGDGSYLTEITLNPKELGQVRLQVHVNGNTVSMQATALDPATRALLNTGLDDLSQALVDAGLESGHLDVSQGDGQTGDGTANDQPFAGFGTADVQVIEEEDLTMAGASADYITSTSVNTLA